MVLLWLLLHTKVLVPKTKFVLYFVSYKNRSHAYFNSIMVYVQVIDLKKSQDLIYDSIHDAE